MIVRLFFYYYKQVSPMETRSQILSRTRQLIKSETLSIVPRSQETSQSMVYNGCCYSALCIDISSPAQTVSVPFLYALFILNYLLSFLKIKPLKLMSEVGSITFSLQLSILPLAAKVNDKKASAFKAVLLNFAMNVSY